MIESQNKLMYAVSLCPKQLNSKSNLNLFMHITNIEEVLTHFEVWLSIYRVYKQWQITLSHNT